jgi:hypothetical protein
VTYLNLSTGGQDQQIGAETALSPRARSSASQKSPDPAQRRGVFEASTKKQF